MAERILEEESSNYEIFRECVSEPILKVLAAPEEKPKRRKKEKKARNHVKNKSRDGDIQEQAPVVPSSKGTPKTIEKDTEGDTAEQFREGNDAEDLGDFIDVIPPSPILITLLT